MRRTSNETSLLGYLVQLLRQEGKVDSVFWSECPTHEQNVLDIFGGLQVGQWGLHPLAYQPDDGFGWHVLPRPLPCQQLIPAKATK